MSIKVEPFYILLLTVLLSNGCCITDPGQSTSGDKVRVKWVRSYSQGGFVEEESSLISSSDRAFFVLGESSYYSQGDYHYERWLWKIDEKGNRVWQKPFALPGVLPNEESEIEELLCSRTDRLIVAHEVTPHKQFFYTIGFDEDGVFSLWSKHELRSWHLFPQGIASTNDGFLIVGGKGLDNGDAWVLKLDPKGNKLWEKTYDKSKDEHVTSAAVTENGEILLAANSGSYNKFGAGPSEVWILKCDKEGKVLAETVLQGRHPAIAAGKEGIVAVVYNRANFPEEDICVVGLDDRLNAVWKVESLSTEQVGGGIFNIAAGSKGGFVVAGSKMDVPVVMAGWTLLIPPLAPDSKIGLPWIWKIDKNGNIIWELELDTGLSLGMVYGLLATDDGCIITGSADLEVAALYDPNGQVVIDRSHDDTDIFVASVAEDSR